MGKYVLIGIVVIILLIVLGLVLEVAGLKWSRWILPQKEAVRRAVFEESKSYNESKKQDLIRYRLQYLNADAEEKKAIESTIRMMFSDYDENKLDLTLRSFLKKIKYGGY